VPQHLTYRVLRDVLGGLRDFVFEKEMYLGLSFDVGDEIRGKLGEGILRPGLAPRVGNSSAVDLDVEDSGLVEEQRR